MHRKTVVVVASVLFSALAVVAFVFADLLDRSYPFALHARALVTMDFSTADIRDEAALSELTRLDERFDMGVVRVLPELGGEQSGEVFAVLGSRGREQSSVARFSGQPPSRVVSADGLAFSFADGTYLLTGDKAGDPALEEWLARHGVRSRWSENNPWQAFRLATVQPPVVIAFVSAWGLLTSLVLYWATIKARSRSLRVLGGVRTLRIQYEDVGSLLWLLALPAAAAVALATGVVTWMRGTIFTWYYASVLGVLVLTLLLLAALGALATLALSWPSSRSLATRTPPAGSLRRVAKMVTAVTFVLVLLAVGPAVSALSESSLVAAQQTRWRALADQVLLSFPSSLGDKGFVRVRDQVKEVVADAERKDAVAMSYGLPLAAIGVEPEAGGGYDEVALVNSRWMSLMASGAGSGGQEKGGAASTTTVSLTPSQIPPGVKKWLDANLPLWVPGRQPAAVEALWRSVKVLSVTDPAGVPLALGGGGDLEFPGKALVLVVDDIGQRFDADFLTSLASSRNMTFTGLQPTIGLLEQHGLRRDLQIRYAAEAGVLRAQFATYTAWLNLVAVVSLAAAFLTALMVGTIITGLLSARRNFPLRLGGNSWPGILAPTVLTEWSVGSVLVVTVLAMRREDDPGPVLALAVVGLLVSAAMHLGVSRWTFGAVAGKKL